MSSSDSIEDPPLNQIVKRYFELLKEEELISPELLNNLTRLFDSGRLGSYNEIAKILKPKHRETDEDSRATD
jgi:hypothetical protein